MGGIYILRLGDAEVYFGTEGWRAMAMYTDLREFAKKYCLILEIENRSTRK